MSLIRFHVEISFVRRILYSICYGQRNLSLPFPLSYLQYSLKKTSHLVDTNRISFFSSLFRKKNEIVIFSTIPRLLFEKNLEIETLSSPRSLLPAVKLAQRLRIDILRGFPANRCKSVHEQTTDTAAIPSTLSRRSDAWKAAVHAREESAPSPPLREKREKRARRRREKEKEKRFRPTAVATKSGWHWYSGRMANTEAPDPRPFPSFSTTHSPLFSPFGSPPPPPDHPCYTPFPSPFCPFDDAPPQRRHAHSDLIQFPINSQSIDSNSVYRAVGCLPMYPLHAYEPALPTLSLPLLFLLLPFRSPFSFPFALFLALRPLVLSPRSSNWVFFLFGTGVRVTAIRREERDSMVLLTFEA